MFTLVGSRAMKFWFPDAREPSGDWDYFTPAEVGPEPYHGDDRLDVYENPLLFQANFKYQVEGFPNHYIATPDELYTIKISHLFWVPERNNRIWDKHMSDVIFLQRKGCKLIRPLYDLLFPIWKSHYNTKKTNTNMTKGQFFNDAVVRKYEHDSLHQSVKYHEKPLYEYVLKPGSEVDCDWEKFDKMHPESKIQMIREEIYVTALERILIPKGYEYNARAAYAWSLRQCIISLFKNEWSLFIATHLDELRKPDVDYLQRHRDNANLLILNGETA